LLLIFNILKKVNDMTIIYEVFADGKKIGITVANNEHEALVGSLSGTSRKTNSKCGVECDYEHIQVRPLVSQAYAEARKAIDEAMRKATLKMLRKQPQKLT
jgi:hypothetical protein